MNKIFKNVFFVLVFLSVFVVSKYVSANTTVNLRVTVGSNNIYNKDISVSPCDNDNDGVVDGTTAYCALAQSGLSLDGSWSPYGYFLNGINGISGYADSLGDWHYWEFYTNGSYASVGMASYILSSGDSVWLNFLNPSQDDISKSSTKGGGVLVKDKFSKEKAIDFILSKQLEDGSFGPTLYTDWASIGIAKEKYLEEDDLNKIKDFYKKEKFESKNITDFERHAMALMSLGINPYDGTSVNYIKKIVDSFDGAQIGDKNLINDDIFGLIVLQNAGFTKEDEIIVKILNNIIRNQSESGSWGSVDMTSASIQALDRFKEIPNVDTSIKKAFKFLKKNEIIKGSKGFGNSFSTSWAMQAFALRDYYEDEIERSLKFLTRKQENEIGYIKEAGKESYLWATAYSIPAVNGMSWNDILDDFSKKY
jgi:hypothetical protein